MKATTRVDLHCHSTYSDGTLSPRQIADALAANGVAAAALTDHDSIDGLDEFSRALARRGVGFITGLEITVTFNDAESHLLAYGFDPTNAELRAILPSLRQHRMEDVHSIAGAIRRKGKASHADDSVETPASNGRLDIVDGIALIHRAGGKAVLAHPLILEPDSARLEASLIELRAAGLDGIEAVYEPFTEDQREQLCELAVRLGLLVTGGTDSHESTAQAESWTGIAMPTELWKEFRDAVWSGNTHGSQVGQALHPRRRFEWRHFAFHFIFPTLLAIGLFIGAIYAVFLPAFERSLMDRKREMIRELTNSAWSILAAYDRDARAGQLSLEQAQAMAMSRIEALRYGRERKDYFWLQDMHPRIIMHPYRKELNGHDVSTYRDPRGVRIFVEFADLVRRRHEGYIEYVWQWKDDPSRIVPKESYIKGFAPWGWIIGTGIYIEDVKQEIRRVEKSLVHTSLLIAVIVILLLLYVMRQSLRLERERSDFEESLRESTERYRSLVEATTEGTLLVIGGRCRYANHIFLKMLGCTQRELELLDLSDVFPDVKDNELARSNLDRLVHGDESVEGFDAVLSRRDGAQIECVLTPSRISFADGNGFILLTREVGKTTTSAESDERRHTLGQVVDGLPVGLFRARATSRGTVLECNSAAAAFFKAAQTRPDAAFSLADLFGDVTAYEDFLAEVQKGNTAERRLHLASVEPGTRTVAIVGVLSPDESGNRRYIDGIIEDVTAQEKHSSELEGTIERLQTTLLFLHERVSHLGRSTVFCGLDTPIETVVRMMTAEQSSAALVQSESGVTVGIVTDRDIRERLVEAGVDRRDPVSKIMSSPLVSISERSEAYEALLLMEQRGVQHLAVTDDVGRVIGVIRNQELMQFRNYGPIVLAREVDGSKTLQDVVRSARRAPELAKSLLNCAAHPRHVTQMVSSTCDAAATRLIALAQEEIGPSPVPFAFMALGSHGRTEMTLSSDQDNAIIYEPPDNEAVPEAEEYLSKLAQLVCGKLHEAGYPLCTGNVMAQNPKWLKPLSVWKKYFADWIHRAEPRQLLEFAIFFDFRAVWGKAELARELRDHVFSLLKSSPSFFGYFARESLSFKPPIRLFGRILSGGSGGDAPGALDLKQALMPIVSFARLYALRENLEQTHTMDRIEALTQASIIPESSRQEIEAAYDFLMRLRLRQQVAEISAGQKADNMVNQRRLGHLEETLLNQSFAQITAVQKRISYDFLGGTS